jgi:hypothetical protein
MREATVDLERSSTPSGLEALRAALEEEEIPAVIERDGKRAEDQWVLRVAESAADQATRVLANRRALGALIDWDTVDVGEPTEEVKAVLASSSRVRHFSILVRRVGAIVGFIVVALGILGAVLTLLR